MGLLDSMGNLPVQTQIYRNDMEGNIFPGSNRFNFNILKLFNFTKLFMRIKEKITKNGYLLQAGDNYIELIKHEQGGYDFNRFKITNIKNKKLINELRIRFNNFAKKEKCIIQSEDSERDKKQSKFLIDSEFVIEHAKHCFQKNLTRHTFPYNDIFKYLSINETGIEKFYKIFKASANNPIKSSLKFNQYMQRIKKSYCNEDCIENWKSVILNGRPIGIIMPFRILTTLPPGFLSKKEVGTLLNFGLIPEERGKGYGRIIHSKGLMILKDMGLKTYLGSTESNNYAMLRVFRINKCRRTLIQNFYRVKG
jgi:hypothetical protein